MSQARSPSAWVCDESTSIFCPWQSTTMVPPERPTTVVITRLD